MIILYTIFVICIRIIEMMIQSNNIGCYSTTFLAFHTFVLTGCVAPAHVSGLPRLMPVLILRKFAVRQMLKLAHWDAFSAYANKRRMQGWYLHVQSSPASQVALEHLHTE